MIKLINKKTLLILIILAIAFFMRFNRNTEIPPSLNWDEVSIAYNAYSVLKTGKDEWGKMLPLHFKSYGEYKLPGQIYAYIPIIYIFGLTDFSVRLLPVVYGVATVFLLYLLTKQLCKDLDMGDNYMEQVSMLASFFLAISPWHIQLTRGSLESAFSVFWICLGILFFLYGLKEKKWLFLSIFPFAIAIYTYNTARVFTPLFLIALALIYRKILLKYKKIIGISAVALFILLTPLIPFVLSGEGSARYKLVSITDDPGLIPRINERRGFSELPGILPRLVHNKVTYISFYIINNYLAHFSPQFLFFSGAPHVQHHVQGMGMFYVFQLPLIVSGVYFLIQKRKDSKFRSLALFLLAWICLGIVPAATTKDSIPHALRTLVIVPPYEILSALGGVYLYTFLNLKFKKYVKSILAGTVILIIISIGSYLNNYYTNYPKNYSRDWQYGNRQAVEFIKENYENYDLIVYTRAYGEPHMFTLFYLHYDPLKYIENPNLDRFETNNWVRVLKFDKFYFPDLGDHGTRYEDIIAQNKDKRILFIGKEDNFPSELPRLKQIFFLNGKVAFSVVDYK